ELAAFLLHLGLPAERLEAVRRAVRGDGALEQEVEGGAAGQRMGALFAAFQSHARALRSYDPRRPGGKEPPVVLFQASGGQTAAGEARAAYAVDGWRRLLGPELSAMDLPGNHFSLLRGEIVERLAEGIRRHGRMKAKTP
ncbi:MAG: hypothetical protein SX243_25585, partial [Acidobacteriota bacterium]|nr:hypothetical protein [Acidobacteriota bacterium]